MKLSNNSAYALDIFFSKPNSSFEPANPIPAHCYLEIGSDNIIRRADPYRILELGSGTGYVGIALANRLRRNCQVYVTDLEEVLPLIHRNVELNRFEWNQQEAFHHGEETASGSTADRAEIIVERLHWGESSHATDLLQRCGGRFDLVIVSDCVYFPELFSLLRETLLQVCSTETALVIGYKERSLQKEMGFWQDYFGPCFKYEPVWVKRDPARNRGNVDKLMDKTMEREENFEIFGAEEGVFTFVARKRKNEDMKRGADDAFTTLLFSLISL